MLLYKKSYKGSVMKIILSLLFFSHLVLAVETINCNVPSESLKKITVSLRFHTDEKSDYLFLQIITDIGTSHFLTQADKGQISSSFENKNFSYLLLSEKSQNNNGVVTNAAYLSIENNEGTVAGFLSAKGNIYPLVCSQDQ